jgi:hypothetical protein
MITQREAIKKFLAEALSTPLSQEELTELERRLRLMAEGLPELAQLVSPEIEPAFYPELEEEP